MYHEDDVVRAEDVDHLEVRSFSRLAPHAPLSIANLLGPWTSRMINDVFRFILPNSVLGDVVQVPSIPTKGIHTELLYRKPV